MALLELRNIFKDYESDGAKVHALDGLSLAVDAGEFVALVGRSGCGKSTLLNLAGAMDFPTSGEVLIDGQPTSGANEQQLTALRRHKVGFVFQSFQLLHTLSAVENPKARAIVVGSTGVVETAVNVLAVGVTAAAGVV